MKYYFALALMSIVSLCGMDYIAKGARIVKIGEEEIKQNLNAPASIAIAIITAAFDAACLYLLVRGV